jgi:glyoxylase-like metal-dependent hydrolase (beta-lactamase superfamily II)
MLKQAFMDLILTVSKSRRKMVEQPYTTRGRIVMDQDGQTRRQILKGAIGGAAGILLSAAARPLAAAPAQAASPGTGVQRLSDDLFVVTIPGEANVVAHTTADGVLLVDGGSAGASDALMKEVASLSGGGPVHTIFNTHWHPEQTGSNEQLGKAGRTIIAHENTRLWLTTDVTWPWSGQRFKRAPRIAQPNKTFYTTGTLDTPSTEAPSRRSLDVRYGYIPDAAHTDGDLYVSFPKQNVLAVGDVVSGQGWPVVDWVTGGWIGGIVGGLQRLQALANEETRIVPARGPVLSLADLKTQHAMYGTIYERLTQLLNRGRGPGEAVAAGPTKEFDAQMGNPDEFVRRAFESLWAYVSPDA